MARVVDVAIVGGGFCAVLTAYHIHRIRPQLTVAIISADKTLGLGAAYSTKRPEHLLNVRAANMSALPDYPEHFVEWLAAKGGAFSPESFISRDRYGEYAQSFLPPQTHHIPCDAATLTDTGVRTVEGEDIQAAQVVCASGFVFKGKEAPWHMPFESFRANERIALIGTGLTAVDVIQSLAKTGFAGTMYSISRHGWWPSVHAQGMSCTAMNAPQIPTRLRLSGVLRYIRAHLKTHPQLPWQHALDMLRPYHNQLWNSLSATDKKRALTRYFTLWNIHRHRMPPEAMDALTRFRSQGNVIECHGKSVLLTADAIRIHGEPLYVDRVIDCRGPHYGTLPAYLLDAIAAGWIGRHESGSGLKSRTGHMVGHTAHTTIYAIGSVMLGEWLETTAVPDLRHHALALAQAIAA